MHKFFAMLRADRRPSTPRFSRPCLELLEDRNCPTTPQLTLEAQVMPNHVVQLMGQLTNDANVQAAFVSFSGAVGGSCRTDANGDFFYSTSGAQLGQESAVAEDVNDQMSNTATTTIATPVSSLTLSVSYGSQKTVTLTGQVSGGVDTGGLIVTFTGKVTGTVATNADGTFSFTTQASALGTVSATVQDAWGQNSSPATVTLTANAPTIISFNAVHESGDVWTFQGQVQDSSPQGLIVTFGGTPTLQGKTATVQSDGSFSLTLTLPSGEDGTATAQITDWWNLQSNQATCSYWNDY